MRVTTRQLEKRIEECESLLELLKIKTEMQQELLNQQTRVIMLLIEGDNKQILIPFEQGRS